MGNAGFCPSTVWLKLYRASYYDLMLYSLIKGSWALWEARVPKLQVFFPQLR